MRKRAADAVAGAADLSPEKQKERKGVRKEKVSEKVSGTFFHSLAVAEGCIGSFCVGVQVWVAGERERRSLQILLFKCRSVS
jgi:hypothetical protein